MVSNISIKIIRGKGVNLGLYINKIFHIFNFICILYPATRLNKK
jgi:hypothetical protein